MKDKSKRGQDKKSKIPSLHSKRAQEEMVGFGLIIVIVAVVLLVFVSLTFRKPGVEVESYEVESFLNSLLQKTTDCESFTGYIDVEDLIEECMDNGVCADERNACLALNESIKETLEEYWVIENRPLEGYELNIVSETGNVLALKQGNSTNNYKSAIQILQDNAKIDFRAYY